MTPVIIPISPIPLDISLHLSYLTCVPLAFVPSSILRRILQGMILLDLCPEVGSSFLQHFKPF
jgi:hypothetical protein